MKSPLIQNNTCNTDFNQVQLKVSGTVSTFYLWQHFYCAFWFVKCDVGDDDARLTLIYVYHTFMCWMNEWAFWNCKTMFSLGNSASYTTFQHWWCAWIIDLMPFHFIPKEEHQQTNKKTTKKQKRHETKENINRIGIYSHKTIPCIQCMHNQYIWIKRQSVKWHGWCREMML